MTISSRVIIRRGLFIAVHALVLIALYQLAIGPVVALFAEQSDRILSSRSALERYRRIAGREDAVRQATAQAVAVASSTRFLQGSSEGTLNAGLQAHLKALAEQAGAQVQSIRAVEPLVETDIRLIGAHVELTGPIAAIRTTLQAIEGRAPYLFIHSAHLRMPAVMTNSEPTSEPPLDAQFDVYGPVSNHAAR